MESLIELFSIDDSNVVRLKNKSAVVVCYLMYFMWAGRAVIGDENSGVYRVLKYVLPPSRIIFLDDGVATLSSKSKLKRFTIFHTKDSINNEFLHVSEKISKSSKGAGEEKVIFVGGKLSEAGICSKEDYFLYLRYVLNEIKEAGEGKVLYIPHRGEYNYKDFFTKKNCNIFNVEIYENNLPVELIALEKRIRIKHVVSFFSTAMFSMAMIYKDANFVFYELPHNDIQCRKEAIVKLYEFIRDQGFRLLPIACVK
ncbi:polysialyltransferase family glycosyltransferase [Modicisalibacter xianhensis]|nr:polysialyltransferase family glycosyltransferase [Halomonas xianhensis]